MPVCLRQQSAGLTLSPPHASDDGGNTWRIMYPSEVQRYGVWDGKAAQTWWATLYVEWAVSRA